MPRKVRHWFEPELTDDEAFRVACSGQPWEPVGEWREDWWLTAAEVSTAWEEAITIAPDPFASSWLLEQLR